MILLALLFSALAQADCDGPVPQWEFVYTSQPRHTTKVGPMDDASNWQRLNDLERVWQQAESDVVIDRGGKITVIHNCTASPDVCTAQEARVSPDGKRIVYSVSRGSALNIAVWANGLDTGLREFDTLTAELWLYDIPTGKGRRLSSGHIDRSPSWASNDLIVFASDRAGTYSPTQMPGINYYPRQALHVHRARITDSGLSDVADITPAEYFAQNPEITTRGWVMFSSFQGVNNRFPREFGVSTFLHWWICSTDINGGDPKCHLGAHGSGQIKRRELIADWVGARAGEINTAYRGLRVVGEIYPDYLATTNYYAGRSAGGVILGWPWSDAEGTLYENKIPAMAQWGTSSTIGSGRYTPSGLLNMTPGRNDQDTTEGIYHKDGRGAGRESHPAPWPDSWGFTADAWLSTGWRGRCYENARADEATVAAQGGEPTCKREIRLNLARQVTNPFDPAQGFCIAGCSLDVHAYDARPIATYRDLYGIDAPRISDVIR